MIKLDSKDGPCDWERQIVPLDVEELHQVLNCASGRGCSHCVKCSELALEQMLKVARKAGRAVVVGLERLEADMEFAGAFGL
jgi:hypothetical protein